MTNDLRDALGTALPIHATAPDANARHELGTVEKVSAILGTPLLPWQRYVARVATEKNPDGSYRYPVVVLTVPRQSGKTSLFRAILTARALTHPNRRAFMTAQTQKDATERLFDLVDNGLLSSPIGKTIKVRRAAGTPRVTFHNDSRLQAFAPSAESLHGYTPHDVWLDEVFAYTTDQGSLLLGAITPAQQTVKDRQLLLCSTMGTPQSGFLNGWVDKGRQAVNDSDSQIAYFEWALHDGLDPYNPEHWSFHPGLQGGLITKADISQAAETMTQGEFTRAYMNRPTAVRESLFDMTGWQECRGTLSIPNRSQVAVAYEVSKDRSRAAVVAAWRDESRRINVKVLRNDSGTDWLVDTLLDLHEARPLAIGADRYPQNLVIADQLAAIREDFPLVTLKPESLKTGSASLKAHIEDRTLRHEGHLALTSAIQSAVSRPMGEGWALSHNSEPEAFAALTAIRLVEEVRAESRPAIYALSE